MRYREDRTTGKDLQKEMQEGNFRYSWKKTQVAVAVMKSKSHLGTAHFAFTGTPSTHY